MSDNIQTNTGVSQNHRFRCVSFFIILRVFAFADILFKATLFPFLIGLGFDIRLLSVLS